MTDQISTSNTIRSELVDIATEFLNNPKIIGEEIERKREFLKKKGLTDTEIHYAFQLVSPQENTKQIISSHQSSFLRQFLNDFIFASILVFSFKTIKQFFHSNQSNEKIELNETIKNLKETIRNMQMNVVKLEQTTDQLNLTIQTSKSNQSSLLSIEEVKQEIQDLKELFLNRSQFPQILLKTSNIYQDNNNDDITIISNQESLSDI